MKWAKANWGTVVNLVLGLVNAVCLYFVLFPTLIQLDMWRGISVHDAHHRDALSVAVSLGRLDAVSVLLTVLGVLLGLLAIVSFSYFKYGAEEVARSTADKVARDTTKELFEREASERASPTDASGGSPSGSDAKRAPDVESVEVRDKKSEDEKGRKK